MSADAGHRDRCAISGIGATDFSTDSKRSQLTLAAQAGIAAIRDAGLKPDQIDGVVRMDYDQVLHNDLAHALNLANLTYWGISGTAGSAPCAMIGQAVAAILSGQAKNVLVFRALNGSSGLRLGKARNLAARVGGGGTLDEFFLPYGLVSPGQMWALFAQRHMHEFGTTSEQLAHIALTCRARANVNRHAQMRAQPLTMDKYLDARMISAPLRLYDYCLQTDGACAVVVTSTERARDGSQPPVLIRAVAQAASRDEQGGIGRSALMRWSLTDLPSGAVARLLYTRAGMGPSDIDVAQFYDCFTITALTQLEDYGFCAKGEGGPFAASGAIGLDGTIPINTAGGNLSEGYIQGMNHIVEGVRQLRGTSANPVRGAQTCLVTSGLPIATSALLLRTDS